jgi:FixJ family two-component response regulator
MVDDDVSEHARVKALLPTDVELISAYSAAQAIDRCRQLLALHAHVRVVLLLDYRLPDLDGAMLAAKLRDLVPEAPILSLSNLPESGPLIGISGATSSLSKHISDDALREQLVAVIAQPAVAPPEPLLASYLAGHATHLALLRTTRPAVAVLASSRPLLSLFADVIQQSGFSVGVQSVSAPTLAAMLPSLPVQALVSDGPAWKRARNLAEGARLPLLVIAMALSTAITLSVEPLSVVVAPEPGEITIALDHLLAGNLYRDPRIVAAYEQLELTPAERAVLAYILRDVPIDHVAHELGLSESAVRKARSRALARLNAEGIDEVRSALDELPLLS